MLSAAGVGWGVWRSGPKEAAVEQQGGRIADAASAVALANDVLRAVESQASQVHSYHARVTFRTVGAEARSNLLFATTDWSEFVTADYELRADGAGLLSVVTPKRPPAGVSPAEEHAWRANDLFETIWDGVSLHDMDRFRSRGAVAHEANGSKLIVVRFAELRGSSSLTVPGTYAQSVFPLVFEVPVVIICRPDGSVAAEYVSTWTFVPN